MSGSLSNASIVLLIANGFNETEFAEVQRTLLKTGAKISTVSPENSLANGWLGNGWGHYFPVDAKIDAVLGSDYDMMVLVGGERSIAKLAQNPHTSRMVGHFLDAQKPIVAINEAVSLLCMPGRIDGKTIAGDQADARLAASGAKIVADSTATDGTLHTIHSSDIAFVVDSMVQHLSENVTLAAA